METINDTKGWVVDSSSSKNVKVSYRMIPGRPTVSIRIEGIMKAPILNILSLVYETDLFHTWVPLCKRSEQIAKVSRTKQIIRNCYGVPIPFINNRECQVYGYGVNALLTEYKQIMAVGRSVYGDAYKGFDLRQPFKGHTRAHVEIVGAALRPKPNGEVEFKFVSNFDPKIKAMPYKLLNWFSRKFSKTLFKKVEKKARNLKGTEFERRMQDPAKRDFYDFIQETLKEFEVQD
jgi:hypothetical protein